MNKKVLLFLITVVGVLWCSPLWAADKDTPQKNYWVADQAEQRDQTGTQNFWTGGSQVSAINPKSSVFKTFPQPTSVNSKDKSFQFVSSAGNNSKAVPSSRAPFQLPKLQPQVTGPQDICPFTAVCYNPSEPEICAVGFPGGVLCSYQDPSLTCPVPPATCPAYPFQVNTIYVKLCNPGPNPCDIQVIPAILDSKDSLLGDGTVCHVPGALLCTGPQQTIHIPPGAQCVVYSFPLNQPCCVDSDYFACLDFFVVSPPGQCQFGVCTDNSCSPCCDYWDGGIAGGAWDDLCVAGGPYNAGPLPGNLALWTDGLHSCQNNCGGVQPDTNKNHYKTWRLEPVTFSASVQVRDQFMTDFIQLVQLEYLSNPVRKIVPRDPPDTFNIVDPDDHLTWYRAFGRDTLLKVTYQNQLENTSVCIDSVQYLLVPADKDGHRQDSLDHYKAYRIQNPVGFSAPIQLDDQFDIDPENLTSFLPLYFLTPCQKNLEPTYDLTTHYVAYAIAPRTIYSGPLRKIADQFFPPPGRIVNVLNSELLLVPTHKLNVELCQAPPPDTGNNHYKVWLLNFQAFNATVQVKDQFMSDVLRLRAISFLANPVEKIVGLDTSRILDPDDHLTWYQAIGTKDTAIKVEYKNQFESTTVVIDSVRWLLVPTTKFPHPPWDSLDHYKCYYIRNPQWLKRPPFLLQDQFDGNALEQIDSLQPVYFCTPCSKDNSQRFDTLTHYVAYYFAEPPKTVPSRGTSDQFGPHTLSFIGPWGLLVPTEKLRVEQTTENCCFPFPGGSCGPVPVGTCVPSGGVVVPACLGDLNGNGINDACDPVTPPDTLRNHFKTWRVVTQPAGPFDLVVRDQFTIYDFLRVDTIEFLSNPVRKIVIGATQNDTFDILRPDDHLTWYRGKGKVISVSLEYSNQFESTKVFIDSVKYLLLPTQKDPHPRPDSLLGHYTAYKVRNPKGFRTLLELNDQFDINPEIIDSLVPRYFLVPAQKETEPVFGPDTHYVAYEIFPKGLTNQPTRTTTDQFGPHAMQILRSEYLLVPTEKIKFTICTHKPNDCNGDGTITLPDIICDVNVVFKGAPKPVPNCRCDSNNDGVCTLPDIVYKVNYVFKGGPKPIPTKECCISP